MLSRKNLIDAVRVPIGIIQSIVEVARFRPHVVFATGGYVSVPPVLAASVLGVPSLIHEQTVQIGLANRIAARVATKIALTFPEAADDLPTRIQKQTIVTGNPVRQQIFDGYRSSARERFGFSESPETLPAIYVTGGALGSRIINRAIEEILPRLLAICCVIHQCGRQQNDSEQDFDRLIAASKALPHELRTRYFLTPFVGEEIGDVYALSDLVVGRSGAGTVAEVCALGKASIFIPLVPTGGDEQNRNAQRLASIGAAVILPSSNLTGDTLLDAVSRLIIDPTRLNEMGLAAKTLARPNAETDLSNAILRLSSVVSDGQIE
jgi:UDP-N-acetylglucosamine--N-acetylmuramyl-(pentapeptide) pyrophosphoryl-undecaprenol N-acetylglucosamine transferase